ncbi:MAG: hypothetical protein H6Q90_1051 [Deltaproteobacteria bacterium]|nr:hypothetical protein [Deltaproteobacteria bacterium]
MSISAFFMTVTTLYDLRARQPHGVTRMSVTRRREQAVVLVAAEDLHAKLTRMADAVAGGMRYRVSMLHRVSILVFAGLALSSCGGRARTRDAYAVGAYVGVGSVFGPGPTCRYDAKPPSIAELNDEKTVGKLVGAGELTMTCESGYSESFDVLAPTSAQITGEAQLEVGAAQASYAAVPRAGARELKTDGHFAVAWSFGPDCASSVTTEVDMPAGGDSLHGSYHLRVTPKSKGTCTVTAEILGQKATLAIAVK